MSAHTPGPWMVPHFARDDHPCNCPHVLAEGYMGSVATVHNEERDGEHYPAGEEAKANAGLIAAAPDLLEALKAIADCTDEAFANERFEDTSDAAPMAVALMEARAAIKKALGS